MVNIYITKTIPYSLCSITIILHAIRLTKLMKIDNNIKGGVVKLRKMFVPYFINIKRNVWFQTKLSKTTKGTNTLRIVLCITF